MKRFMKAVAAAVGVFAVYVMVHYACAWALPFGTHIRAVCANGTMLLLLVLFTLGIGRKPLHAVGGERFSVRALLPAVGIGIGACFLVRLLLLTVPFPDSWQTSYTVQTHTSREPTVWRWIAVLAAAPLAEEIMFRGVIYRILRGVMPWAVASVFSAALFASLHGTPLWMLYTWLLGMVLCRVYECTRSVWLCAIAHAAFNGMGQIPLIGVLPDAAVTALFFMGLLAMAFSLWYIENRKARFYPKGMITYENVDV